MYSEIRFAYPAMSDGPIIQLDVPLLINFRLSKNVYNPIQHRQKENTSLIVNAVLRL
jgi:hypothetical protein